MNWEWPADWIALQSAADSGHEIASHTVTHTSLNGLSDSLQIVELRDSQDEINAHITGQRCITFAYPFCETGKKSIIVQFYIAARICSGQIESSTPRDFMGISSIICGELGSVKTTQNFIDKFVSALNSKGWCVLLIHGIDNDGGWSSLSSTALRESLEYLDANQGNFWVSTFGNVVRYIIERNAVSVAELSVEDTAITLQVTDTLDNTIYDYPVTLRRPLPQGWADASVSQNGHTVDAQIVEVNSMQHVMFDVVPDSGDILITKNASTGVRQHGSLKLLVPSSSQNYPNPFNPYTTISYDLIKPAHVILKIYNIHGQEIQTLVDEFQTANEYKITWQPEGLPGGIYFYRLQVGNFLETKKSVLLK